MIFPLFRRNRMSDTISALYGIIVAQARTPAFYRDFGVPDTVDGRFELVLLHLFLLLRRFDGDEAARELGQQVFDLFCRDMDQNLREMGVSDLKVPKEMRRIGEAFYGRARVYEASLASNDGAALRIAIARNVMGNDNADDGGAVRLAAYIRNATSRLATQNVAAFKRGLAHFPELT
jgi:cytochrome b pre-mRNA-processing protein 3